MTCVLAALSRSLLEHSKSLTSATQAEQEAPLRRRAQRVRRAYWCIIFMTFIGRQTTDQQLISHLHKTALETYQIPRNIAK